MKRLLLILLACSMLLFSGVSYGDDNLMQQGDKGEEVVRIQKRLFDLGFYTYKPTGSYQTVTKSAVMEFQAASGLMSDGTIGAETVQALFAHGAKRVDFHAEVPLTFTAQGTITKKGNATVWSEWKSKLVKGKSYRVRNAATGEDVTLVFSSGKNHAEMTLPTEASAQQAASEMLSKWLGSTNSFYKCAVLLELDGQWIAASIQWNGAKRVCLYGKDSLSHVLSLPDAEHEANVRRASY